MAEPDRDLPLVVAEILLEMHGMNSHMAQLEHSTNRVEKAVNKLAETMLLQQQEVNKRFELLMEADRANTTMLINAFRDEASATRSRLDSTENRLERLETR